jgi:2-oxoglutarate dehydrogenase E2 component (dihydrolipoamide succinyltransferase)
MAIEVKVPMLPESIADATVSTWHKKVGDTVTRDENLVDLETDKVMLEVPAPADGILKEIIKPEGETVQANQVIAVIEAGGAATAEKPAAKAAAAEPAAKPAAAAPAAKSAPATASTASSSPSVRRVAAENDVDLNQVKGTGKGGRITKENVMSEVGSQTNYSDVNDFQ